jgi:uncharacterized protein YbdZ (MbtH family)
MKKSTIRLLKWKSHRFFKVSLEIITGWQHVDNEKVRQENIDYIFKHTIHWMPDIIKEYDACFNSFKNHDHAFTVALSKLSA